MRTLVTGFLALSLLAGVAQARTWVDATGQTQVEGELVGMTPDGRVMLRLKDGKVQAAPLAKFSEADQQFVKEQAGLKSNTPAAAPAAPAAPEAASTTERFDAQIAAAPQDPRGYYLRGLALVNKGKADEGMKDFNKAIELDPKFADAYDGRGLANMKSGKSVQAHEDFSKSIELNPELASAYRHRADNLAAVSKTEEGRKMFEEAAENYKKKYNFADKSNMRNSPWQPLNTTSGNVSRGAAINLMAKNDYDRAVDLEGRYGGGYSVGGGGVAIGGPGVVYAGPAPAVIAPPGVIALNPPLAVYPAEVTQGDYVTLVANPTALQNGMPSKIGPNGKPVVTRGKAGANKEDIVEVEFYRDLDGDGKLNTGNDKLLGADADPKDGFSIKVSTSEFAPGNQAYFALPKGREGSGANSAATQKVIDAVSLLEKAAATEREIAKATAEAGNGEGLSKEAAEKLKAQQEIANTDARKAYQAVQNVNPEATAALKEAAAKIKGSNEALAAATLTPGADSKPIATSSSQSSDEAAVKLAEAASKLRAYADAQAKAAASGRGAAASGKINPGSGGPGANDTAGGPGGKDGDGKGKDGYGGKDGGDYVDGRDFARDDVAVNDTVDRARGFYANRDYDSAIREYDRLVVSDPDNVSYIRERAGTYLEGGSYDYAIRDYDRLIDVDVKNADLYYNRGCAYLAVGKLDEAMEDFNKSIALDETRNLAYTNRGTTYAKKGMFEQAVGDFSTAIKMNPSDKLAVRNRALAYKKLGQPEKAAEDIARLETIGGE